MYGNHFFSLQPSCGFFSSFENFCQIYKIFIGEKLIILGDLNSEIRREVIDQVIQECDGEVINRTDKIIVEFGAYKELRITNTNATQVYILSQPKEQIYCKSYQLK